MKVRKHFRTSRATIDYIISDFSFNRISNKDLYFKHCVTNRMAQLNDNYNEKVDKILNFIIRNCRYDNMPIHLLSKIILSLSKVTNALSKGFLYLIDSK